MPTTDKRALAYVNVLGGGQVGRAAGYDVGLEQIRAGWADLYIFEDEFARFYSYSEIDADAEGANVGVYGRCGGEFHTPA